MGELSNRNLAGAVLAAIYGALSLFQLVNLDVALREYMPAITRVAPGLALWIGLVMIVRFAITLAMIVGVVMLFLRRRMGLRLVQIAAATTVAVAIAYPVVGLPLIPVGASLDEFRESFRNAAIGTAFISTVAMGVLLALLRPPPLSVQPTEN